MDKQIKELATEILQEFTRCYSEADEDCLVKMIKKVIPENAVVLTREEYDELTLTKQSIFDMLEERDDKARKETAEKFAAQMKVLLSSNTYFVLANKEKLHKVIDGICKEITGTYEPSE